MKETKADLVQLALVQVGMLHIAHRIAKRKVTKRAKALATLYLYLQLMDWSTRGLPIPKQRSLLYTLNNIDAEYCLEVARFYPADLRRIRLLLHLEDEYVTPERVHYGTDDALLLLCWRLASTEKFSVLVTHFTWNDGPTCKLIMKHIVNLVLDRVLPLLRGGSPLFTADHIEKSAQFIARAWNMVYAVIFAFVDSRLWKTSKPKKFQRSVYSDGKHHAHGLHGQAIIDAFGLLIHFFCPVAGRHHDAFVWHQSGVYDLLEAILGNNFKALFGDSAYPRSNRLVPMVKNPRTPQEREINTLKAALRVCVEHGLNKIAALFPLLDIKRKMRILLSPVASWINIAAFLTNCHTLLYGSQVSDYFYSRSAIPDLEDYIILPE